MSKEDNKDSILILAGFNKQEAEDAAFKQLMKMYDMVCAIFMMFMVSEIHPFTDGNGRVMMNAELVKTMNRSRIILLSAMPLQNHLKPCLRGWTGILPRLSNKLSFLCIR